MKQVREIINLALSKIGAINFGENPDTQTSNICLSNLQMLLDEFDIRYSNTKRYYEIVTAKNTITLGTDNSNILAPISGDIAERPATITDVVVQIGMINYPQVIKPFSEYNLIPIQNINAIPTTVYIDYGYPFMTMYFYPGFGMAANIKIVGKKYRTDEDLTLNDYLEYPREWNAALVSNLALRIAPSFGVAAGQDLIIQASSDLKHVKQLQLVRDLNILRNDVVGNRGFNFLAGM